MISAGAIAAIQKDWRVFPPACKILTEDEQVTLLNYTPTQRVVVDAWAANNRIYVCKYRQAKITTVLVLALLGQVMVGAGLQGLVIANAVDTGLVAFGRANYAYANLPQAVQIPLLGGRSDPAKKQIMFLHRGGIRVLTGRVSRSAIGNSPDRVLLTEYAEYDNVTEFNAHFFPSVNKRPNAKIAIETTPGRFNSAQHKLWLNSLAGNSRFTAVFLPWWLDDSCRPVDPAWNPASFRPTLEELRYFERLSSLYKLDPAFFHHRAAFRRDSILTDFNESPELFDHKYPPGPLQGWVASNSPAIPADVAERLLAGDSIPFGRSLYPIPDEEPHRGLSDVALYELPDPDQGTLYLLTCDPAGFGATGDPSGLIVWNAKTGREVAVWLGRTDPNIMADRAMKIQAFFGTRRTMMVIESNKGEMLAALIAMKARNVFCYKEKSPGLFASAKTNEEANSALVDMLRHGKMTPRNKETITQLSAWDGVARSKRVSSEETGDKHHFELAVCCRLAAWTFRYDATYERALTGVLPPVQQDFAPQGDYTVDVNAQMWAMLNASDKRRKAGEPVIHGVGGVR